MEHTIFGCDDKRIFYSSEDENQRGRFYAEELWLETAEKRSEKLAETLGEAHFAEPHGIAVRQTAGI